MLFFESASAETDSTSSGLSQRKWNSIWKWIEQGNIFMLSQVNHSELISKINDKGNICFWKDFFVVVELPGLVARIIEPTSTKFLYFKKTLTSKNDFNTYKKCCFYGKLPEVVRKYDFHFYNIYCIQFIIRAWKNSPFFSLSEEISRHCSFFAKQRC